MNLDLYYSILDCSSDKIKVILQTTLIFVQQRLRKYEYRIKVILQQFLSLCKVILQPIPRNDNVILHPIPRNDIVILQPIPRNDIVILQPIPRNDIVILQTRFKIFFSKQNISEKY